VRAELSADEKQEHYRRKKELWEARQAELQSAHHAPIESKRADGRGHRRKGFAAETAASIGKSKSQINRRLAGKKLKSETNRAVAEQLRPITSTSRVARKRPQDRIGYQARILFDAFNEADKDARDKFLLQVLTKEVGSTIEAARAYYVLKLSELEPLEKRQTEWNLLLEAVKAATAR
jgi:hypothetical protein